MNKKDVIGYIKTHWKGENSLAWAYWINGALINVTLTVAITVADNETDILDYLLPWLLMAIGSVGVTIWSLVGIWRSATHSMERARVSVPKKSSFWAYAAKFMVIMGVLQNVALWLPVLMDLNTLYKVSESDIATQFYIQYSGSTDVILNGYINVPSVEAVKNAFLADKNRNALVLNSPGGLLLPAYDLADFVEQRKIIVAARSHCESSCLLVLTAAKIGLVTPDTRLVFHHPKAIADFVSEGMAVELNKEIDEYYARFRRYGVPEENLAELRRQGSKVLSIGEAFNAFIIDKIWEPKSNKFYEVQAVCEQVDCFISPMKFP